MFPFSENRKKHNFDASAVQISFSSISPKLSTFKAILLHNLYVNAIIAVILSWKWSLYDLQEPRYEFSLFAPEGSYGRGPPGLVLAIHNGYLDDFGPGLVQEQRPMVKNSGPERAYTTALCYYSIWRLSWALSTLWRFVIQWINQSWNMSI